MSETDLVLLFTRRLERAGFTYMITGSVAGVFYGEPRVTHDVDLVLALTRSDTARIAELKESGLRMIDDVPRAGSHHMQIAFVHPKSSFGVLTELCEPPTTRDE